MRRLLTGAGLAVILLAFSCKTTKRVTSQVRIETERKSETSVKSDVSGQMETEYFGDTIAGRVPLPYLTKKPLFIPIYSAGVSLELTLTDSSAEYRVISKPVARSRLTWSDSSTRIAKVEETSIMQVFESETKKSTGFPWWIWLAVILALAAGVIWVIIKKSIIPN